MFRPQHRPRSVLERRGFWFHAQTGRGNFAITCREGLLAVWQSFDHINVPAALGIYPGFAEKNVNNSRGHAYKCLTSALNYYRCEV